MKRSLIFFSILCFLAFGLISGQQAKPEQKQEQKPDPMANLSLVETIQPVPGKVKVGFESITGKDGLTYLRFLSSDLLEGRETTTPGYQIAAEYAAGMFALWGIKPAGDPARPASPGPGRGPSPADAPAPQPSAPERSYFQTIPFKEILEAESSANIEWRKGLQAESRSFSPDTDYTYFAGDNRTMSAPVVFVGYGIQEKSLNFDEYKNLDVKGKFVLMLTETPRRDDPESPFNKGDLKEKYYPSRMAMRGPMTISPKSRLAKDLGAVAVLMVENSPQRGQDIARRTLDSRRVNDERPIIPGPRRRFVLIQDTPTPSDTIPTINISRGMANAILGYAGQTVDGLKEKIEKSMQPQPIILPGVGFTLKSTVKTQLTGCRNVLGYIEGSDPVLKNEAIVIGAHLDHLGRRGDYIFNGADDNGSGSVGVMEITEAFARNPVKPKRSILFALWTGEEKGLLGSRYYVANPFFPLAKTAVCLNLDMISREMTAQNLQRMGRMMGENIPQDILKKIDMKNFISLSYDANTPALADLLKANNQHVGLALNMRKSESAGGGSDHTPFAMNKVPWVFFIAAMTEDYHQPSDSLDKVSSQLMEKIMRLTYLTAFSLADR